MDTDYELRSSLQAELEADEKLLWAGRPNPARSWLPCLPIVLFGIPWTGFAISRVVGASGILTHGPGGVWNAFPLFSVPFIVVGLGMLSSPLWAYRKALATKYAVTDRRILMITGGRSRSVQSYTNEDIGTVQRTEPADGSGDLIFAREVSHSTDSHGHGRTSVTPIGFYGVPDVRAVEPIVRRRSNATDSRLTRCPVLWYPECDR